MGLVVGGTFAYRKYFKVETATVVPTVGAMQDVKPDLAYTGAYNGALYLTGEKTGSEAPFSQLAENMTRNGIAVAIGYFGIEADQKFIATDNINTIVGLIKDRPGRFTPFYSPGFGSEEVAGIVGAELTTLFKDGLAYSKKAVANGFMKGIGEIEAQAWQVPLTSPEATQLWDFANSNSLSVMLHIRPNQVSELDTVLQTYPDTTFLLHLFANDFEQSRNQIIDLIKRNTNLVYTIDADHMMFDAAGQPPIGLLYKYQDAAAADGAEKFVKDFDGAFNALLEQAVSRFQPLISAAPDRVTIGTEMSADYTFEPQVYDRTVKLIRYFIARQDGSVQENLAYKNAERFFGQGLTLR